MIRGVPIRMALVAVVLLLPALAGAQDTGAAEPKDPYLPYGGVSMRGGEPPSPKPPPPGHQYINWPGFRSMPEGGSEVFLQLTGPVTYKVKQRGRRIEVVIDKVLVYLKNNFRAVLTEHFPGPVKRFQLRQQKGDRITLEIKLRKRATPQVVTKAIGRYTYLVVSFAR